MTVRLKTVYVYPPIPCRDHDWCAYDDQRGEDCSLYGWGATEEEAVRDLIDALDIQDGAALVRQALELGMHI